MRELLHERMTYDQLFRLSEPRRISRSHTVKGPPLEIDSYRDAVYYVFNFKSSPSTTGLRHKGYVKFLRPRRGNLNRPLSQLDCVVDCTCPDYRYRWAWANKQRQASRVGPNSLNQALNRAPRKTNPGSKPGLCKHILAAREYVYSLVSAFPSNAPDTAEKLHKLTQYATKRWLNYPELTAQAKEREKRIAAQIALRRQGKGPKLPAAEPEEQVPEPPAEAPEEPQAAERVAPEDARPPALPDEVTPEAAGPEAAQQPPQRPNRRNPNLESVDSSEDHNLAKTDMNELEQAIKIVEQMEEQEAEEQALMPVDDVPAEAPVPSDDMAMDEDAADAGALDLLREIRDQLVQLNTALAPAEEELPPEEAAEELPPEEAEGEIEGEDMDVPPPPAEGEEEEDEEALRAAGY